MIFTPTVIQNTIPALAVTVADSGVPPVTYAQLKQSLGSYVYQVDGFYMFSDVFNQLISAIKYQQYTANGNQDISSIVTTVDPYQFTNAINVNLKDFNTDIILDGNSSLASTVLPNNYIQLSIFTRRITNSFGQNLNNFKDIEIASNKPDFFDNYGNLSNTNQQVEVSTTLRSADGTSAVVVQQPLEKNDNVPLVFLSLAAVSIGAYLFSKKLK